MQTTITDIYHDSFYREIILKTQAFCFATGNPMYLVDNPVGIDFSQPGTHNSCAKLKFCKVILVDVEAVTMFYLHFIKCLYYSAK